MKIFNWIKYNSFPSMTPVQWAVVGGVTAKVVQYMLQKTSRWASLMAHVEKWPVGKVLLSVGPSLLVGCVAGSVVRLLDQSLIPFQPMHAKVDRDIQSEAKKAGRSSIWQYSIGNCKAFICSNYPKNNEYEPLNNGYKTFCDAFGYAKKGDVQVVAIADGCSWGGKAQRAARAMVDGFFEDDLLNKELTEEVVMEAVQNAQQRMEEKHDESSQDNYYGETTFLGGAVHTVSGKRYFTGVNCGDCKLYHLRNGRFVEITKAARVQQSDSGGSFGPHRELQNKTEYPMTIEGLEPGDQLFFMTDGVHDNLDENPPEKGKVEQLGVADQRKLDKLQEFSKRNNPGEDIMKYVVNYTAKHLKALEEGQDMKSASHKDFPGKPDHMTLLVVQIK